MPTGQEDLGSVQPSQRGPESEGRNELFGVLVFQTIGEHALELKTTPATMESRGRSELTETALGLPNSRPEVDRNEKAAQVFVAFAANSRSGAFRFCSAIR